MAARRNTKPLDASQLPPSTASTSASASLALSSSAPLKSSSVSSASTNTSSSGTSMPAADKWSLALLFLLYTLQGIPLGLSGSLPMLLSQKNVSFSQQALFSLVSWPFSLKLLWAPIVDSIFTRRCGLGRRKSWLIPSQLVCSFLFLVLGLTSLGDGLMGDAPRSWGSSLTANQPDVPLLTLVFFVLYLLMATQDIAVDGWALTMLSPPYVGTASTANSVGQSLGYFAAFVGFMAAYSPEFCNTYIRTVDAKDLEANARGIMGLSDFCTICGVMMLITTIGVWVFKHEGRESESDMDPPLPVPSGDTTSYGDTNISMMACFQPVVTAYHQMWQVIRLPMVISLVFVLATCKIGYGAVDSALSLKLLGKGISKATLAMLAVVTMPCSFVFPLMVAKWTAGARPLDLLVYGTLPRLGVGMIWSAVLYYLPNDTSATVPSWAYALIFILTIVHQFLANMIFCGVMGFFTRVSDPSLGGTYMTLMNTVANLGGKWPATAALYFIEPWTTRMCTVGDQQPCDANGMWEQACIDNGGRCEVTSDGYYIVHNVLTVIGVIWWIVMRHRVDRLTASHTNQWRVAHTN